jgi:hypothetical protein
MIRADASPMPSSSVSVRAGRGPFPQLGRLGVAHDVQRSRERPGAVARVVGAVQQVHDALERFDGGHCRQARAARLAR